MTGESAGSGTNWICELDIPTMAISNGAGEVRRAAPRSAAVHIYVSHLFFPQICWQDPIACLNGVNPCSSAYPCSIDYASCSTGIATGSGAILFCNLTRSPGVYPNGAGQLCFSSLAECINGANSCSVDQPCIQDTDLCGTGQASNFLSATYICVPTIPPGSLPNAAGTICYNSTNSCAAGASSAGSFACVV